MPPITHSTGKTVALGRAPAPAGLSFLPSAVQGRTAESPQTGFQRPVIRAVFWAGDTAYSFQGALTAIGPNIGRIIQRFLIPRTRAGQVVQSLTINAIIDEIFSSLDDTAFGSLGFTRARQYAIKSATRFYRSYFTSTGDHNVSVVFFPESEPGLDLLKWDP